MEDLPDENGDIVEGEKAYRIDPENEDDWDNVLRQ
jgi:hypothetical protein